MSDIPGAPRKIKKKRQKRQQSVVY